MGMKKVVKKAASMDSHLVEMKDIQKVELLVVLLAVESGLLKVVDSVVKLARKKAETMVGLLAALKALKRAALKAVM